MRVYAIADLHGMFDLLELALEFIRSNGDGTDFRVVFTGDYIDRGPDSRKVLERLMAGPQAGEGEEWVCLMGNHEWMMFGALVVPPGQTEAEAKQQAKMARGWHLNGGVQTLKNYQTSSVPGVTRDIVYDKEALAKAVDWVGSLPVLYDDGHRYFVHAMINPNYPLDPTNIDQLNCILWEHVRKNHNERKFREIYGRQVVHGHSPQKTPYVTEHRVNLDVGAYYSNQIAVACWDDDQIIPQIKMVQQVALESA